MMFALHLKRKPAVSKYMQSPCGKRGQLFLSFTKRVSLARASVKKRPRDVARSLEYTPSGHSAIADAAG